MTPWWADVVEKRGMIPIPAEPRALSLLSEKLGLGSNTLHAGFWKSLTADLPALDFSDFLVLVRDDLPEDVAFLLTWCLVETRNVIERLYHHLPPQRSPRSCRGIWRGRAFSYTREPEDITARLSTWEQMKRCESGSNKTLSWSKPSFSPLLPFMEKRSESALLRV